MTSAEIRALLNADTKEQRLANLKTLIENEEKAPEILSQFANNHIHTDYSFSPYSPTAAVYFARAEGLNIAGIMDHDSIGGAEEFRAAGEIAGVATTCGFEARVDYAGTFLENTKLNNPDQVGVGYMAFHSIRREHFSAVQDFLSPLRKKRNDRNYLMVKKISEITGVPLDFEKEVLPLSRYNEGGSVTERHLLFALAGKMVKSDDELERYKLLGKLKAELVPQFFIPAKEELMNLNAAVDLAKQIDCILCYAYLGDVTNSPTGDKKAAQYEDAYLPELMSLLKERGVMGVTFMPSRNTDEQLSRVMSLCDQNSLKQISGEDVNALGQSFICKKLEDPACAHLVKNAWKLIEREK